MLYLVDVEPVGVSHECDHPLEAEEKPMVTSSAVSETGSTEEVNQEVRDAEEEGGVYTVDVELLEKLDPDLLVTQDVCSVCAIDTAEVEEAVDSISSDPEIVNLHSHGFEDVLDDIVTVGEAVDAGERAREAVAELRTRVDAVETEVEEHVDRRPRTTLIEWLEPLMTAGHWTPELVEKAGGSYRLGEPHASSEVREWRDVVDAEPEKLVIAPCGFQPRRTTRELHHLTERSGWREIPAVRDDEVYVVDGHHLVNRPGPRLVDTFERFGEILHPGVFGEPRSPLVQQPMRIR